MPYVWNAKVWATASLAFFIPVSSASFVIDIFVFVYLFVCLGVSHRLAADFQIYAITYNGLTWYAREWVYICDTIVPELFAAPESYISKLSYINIMTIQYQDLIKKAYNAFLKNKAAKL